MRALAIDTDGGIDDFLAIQLALRHPDSIVGAMTVCGGNVPLRKAIRNVALSAVNASMHYDLSRIGIGAARPMRNASFPANASSFHGDEGLTLPVEELTRVSVTEISRSATDILKLLAETCGEHTVSIVAIGPLTNVAMFISENDVSLDFIDHVFIMGGGVEAANETPYAEFNMYSDPEAASEVFKTFSGRITLIPIDACEPVRLTSDEIERLKGSRLSHRLMQGWVAFQKSQGKTTSNLHFTLYDPLAVAVAIAPHLVTEYFREERWVVDTTDGVRRGQTRADETGSRVKVVKRVAVESVKSLMTDYVFGAQ